MLSQVFCCGDCYDSVALIEQPGGDLTYECTNPGCAKTASLGAPEGLALVEDVPLKLARRYDGTGDPRCGACHDTGILFGEPCVDCTIPDTTRVDDPDLPFVPTEEEVERERWLCGLMDAAEWYMLAA